MNSPGSHKEDIELQTLETSHYESPEVSLTPSSEDCIVNIEHRAFTPVCVLSDNDIVRLNEKDTYSELLRAIEACKYEDVSRLLENHKLQHDAINDALVHVLNWKSATDKGRKDIIRVLLQHGADLSKPIKNDKKTTALEMIIENIFKSTEFMESVFDDFITSADGGDRVKISYKILAPNDKDTQQMHVIKALVATGNKYGQRNLLFHPLVDSFIYLKWKGLVPFFYLMFTAYMSLMLSFNIYIVSVYHAIDKYDHDQKLPIYLNPDVWRYFVSLTVGVIALQQFLHIKRKNPYTRLESWIILSVFVPAMFLPYVVSQHQTSLESPEWARLVATIAIFTSWLEMMMLSCRLSHWGYYVMMFGKVTSNVVKIFFTFLFLIFGFSLCFKIQFRSKEPFESLVSAFVKTVVMLVSEFDYEDTLDKEVIKRMAASISVLRLVFVVFLILASIVLMNLMIGVAVNDINDLQKTGNINRLVKQVEFLTTIEESVFYKYLHKIPKVLTKYLKVCHIVPSPCILMKDNDDSCLPLRLKYAILEKVESRKLKMEKEQRDKSYRLKIDELHDAIVNKGYKRNQITRNTADDAHTKNAMSLHEFVNNQNEKSINLTAKIGLLNKTLTKMSVKP